MKKKKTLPADFEEILERGDIAEIREILEGCEIDAHKPYSKQTALFYHELPEEIIRYLVEERGVDINQVSEHGNTPLSEHAFFHPERVPLFLELGADINYFEEHGSAPIYEAANFHRPESVKALLEHGANSMVVCGWMKDTPMECTLKSCRPADISDTAVIAEMFLDKGVPITEEMREEVTRIGKDFEFYRADFNPDYLEETEQGLAKLYQLFSVPPVPKRVEYDGVSPIVVHAEKWQDQHAELWDMLVPGKGHASTVQGEVIRIIGKLCYEILDNGGCNWDREYKKLVKALQIYLKMGKAADKEAIRLAKKISSRSTEDELYPLNRYCVEWVLANPDPIPLDSVNYRR